MREGGVLEFMCDDTVGGSPAGRGESASKGTEVWKRAGVVPWPGEGGLWR